MTTTAESIEKVATDLGLSMTAEFVPWSKSRNAGEKSPSLNWKVTIRKNDRAFLTTDYMAGCGHCPAYKASVAKMGGANSLMRAEAIKNECETGKPFTTMLGMATIMPEFADVISSLCLDANVIDCGSFEEWAGDLGCDTDSRKAEAIYRACLDIALKLRNNLGEEGFKQLREACRNY